MQQPETFSEYLSGLVKPGNPLFHLMPKKFQAPHNFKLWLEKHAFKDVLETVIPSFVNLKEWFIGGAIRLTTKVTPDVAPEIVAMQGYMRVGSSWDKLKKFLIEADSLRELIETGIDFKLTIVDLGYPLTFESPKHHSIGTIRMPGFFVERDLYPFASEYGIQIEKYIFIPLPHIPPLPHCGYDVVIDNRVFKREKVVERVAKGGLTGMVIE